MIEEKEYLNVVNDKLKNKNDITRIFYLIAILTDVNKLNYSVKIKIKNKVFFNKIIRKLLDDGSLKKQTKIHTFKIGLSTFEIYLDKSIQNNIEILF